MMDEVEHNASSLKERRLAIYRLWNERMKDTGNDRIDGQFQIVPNAKGVVGENLQVTNDGMIDEIHVELETGFIARYRRTFVFNSDTDVIRQVQSKAIESIGPFCYRYMQYTCFGVNVRN